MIGITHPIFSAALIAYLDATLQDEKVKRASTPVTPMIDTVADWVDRRLTPILD